jgi:hypothetical protein
MTALLRCDRFTRRVWPEPVAAVVVVLRRAAVEPVAVVRELELREPAVPAVAERVPVAVLVLEVLRRPVVLRQVEPAVKAVPAVVAAVARRPCLLKSHAL